jgi:hypothetical protein
LWRQGAAGYEVKTMEEVEVSFIGNVLTRRTAAVLLAVSVLLGVVAMLGTAASGHSPSFRADSTTSTSTPAPAPTPDTQEWS